MAVYSDQTTPGKMEIKFLTPKDKEYGTARNLSNEFKGLSKVFLVKVTYPDDWSCVGASRIFQSNDIYHGTSIMRCVAGLSTEEAVKRIRTIERFLMERIQEYSAKG